MSCFSDEQLNQLGNALEAAGWNTDDVTRLGQAGETRLKEIRISLDPNSIIFAIEAGKTELWLHDDQKMGGVGVRGHKILAYLRENGLLDSCANLDELKIIQKQGSEFFRRHGFGKKVMGIAGWRGVRDDEVPYLVDCGEGIVLLWDSLDDNQNSLVPGLRRK